MSNSSLKGTALVTHWEAGRHALAQRFGHSVPAARYRRDAPAQQPT
jgi:hypothetical protein